MALDLYLDLLSPYAYLAWRRAPFVLGPTARQLLRPQLVLLGPILAHHGQLGPAEIAPKRAFIIRDTLRRAAEAGVPLVWPVRHPFRSVLAAKVVQALASSDRIRAVDALFRAAWEGGEDLEDATVVRATLKEAGFDAARVLERAASKEISVALRAEGARAVERGVFGVPTFVDDDGELFFGDDQLERIARKYAGHDPLDSARRLEVEKVKARPLAALRRTVVVAPIPPSDLAPELEAYVRSIYTSAPFVRTLGIEVVSLRRGETEVALAVRGDHLQQDGFVHAGVIATLADHNAGGCAATSAPVGSGVLTIEFKVNLLRPAQGARLTCTSKLLRGGKTIAVVESEVFGEAKDGSPSLVAKATVTLAVRAGT